MTQNVPSRSLNAIVVISEKLELMRISFRPPFTCVQVLLIICPFQFPSSSSGMTLVLKVWSPLPGDLEMQILQPLCRPSGRLSRGSSHLSCRKPTGDSEKFCSGRKANFSKVAPKSSQRVVSSQRKSPLSNYSQSMLSIENLHFF